MFNSFKLITMIRKVLVMMGVAAVVMLTAFHISLRSDNNSTLSDLVLANVEVLAQADEIGGYNCTVTGYGEIWSEGCLYYSARCAEGYNIGISLIYCSAK
jgi:hypothetical protein